MYSVDLINLTKKWGNVTAVNDVNLHIEEGEFVVLLGPSGCGKTTTMRLVAGLEEITAGEIKIGDQIVNEIDPRKRDVSMVFQNYSLFPHMSVRNNIAYPLKMKKIPSAEQEKKISYVSKLVELQDLLDRKPAELSGGQRQRVALARAIVRQPRVFLMDEPLSNLDAILRVTMRSELKNLHHRLGVTTIYVTHDQVEAMTLADRIVILNLGNIEQVGSPDEVYTNPSNIFVAQFIGTPKMNIIKITEKDIISNNEVKFLGNNIKFNKINLTKKNYSFGIRPEHFSLSENCQYKFKPNIDLTENLGNEKITYIKIDGNEISAKIPSQSNIIDQIGFDIKDIFVFDETDTRVRS